jgi:hypothetical protein
MTTMSEKILRTQKLFDTQNKILLFLTFLMLIGFFIVCKSIFIKLDYFYNQNNYFHTSGFKECYPNRFCGYIPIIKSTNTLEHLDNLHHSTVKKVNTESLYFIYYYHLSSNKTHEDVLKGYAAWMNEAQVQSLKKAINNKDFPVHGGFPVLLVGFFIALLIMNIL